MKKKTIFIILLLLVLAVGGRFYWNMQMAKWMTPPSGNFAVPVIMYKIVPEVIEDDIKAVGTMYSNESATIRPEISGIITSILFSEGDQVKTGDPLLEIDDKIYKAEQDAAKASYDLARLTYNRRNELQRAGANSIQERDEARAKFDDAAARLKIAKEKLDKTRIFAPFSGIIGLRKVSQGDYIEAGQVITNIEDLSTIKVEFTVPEKYFSAVSVGQTINIRVDAYPDKVFIGKVYAIDPQIDVDDRNVSVKAELDNANRLLRPGMFASIELITQKIENALMIPEQAIIPKGNDLFVYRVDNKKAKLVPVKAGLRKNAKVLISEGLHEGDVVVTEGHMKLQDGSEVADAEQMQREQEQKAAKEKAK